MARSPSIERRSAAAPREVEWVLARRLRRAGLRLGLSDREIRGVAIHIVDDLEIAALNRRHMGKRGPTDVLSFPTGERERFDACDVEDAFDAGDEVDGGEVEDDAIDGDEVDEMDDEVAVDREVIADADADASNAPVLLGDIVLSWPAVLRQAGRKDLAGLLDEASVLVIHGLVHLLGHDHGRSGEGRRMHRVERRALAAARVPDIPRPYGLGLRR